MLSRTSTEFGNIDILVLSGSITFPIVPFIDFKWKDFEYKLTRELKAAFFCCKEVVPGMIKQNKGNVIAVSSGL